MERAITGLKQYKPIPKQALRALLDHQCWLASAGWLGRRLGSNQVRIDFSDLDLDGFDFSFAKLNGGCFNGASLRSAWFIAAELSGAEFESCCDATGARFDGADLSEASFVGATYPGARFDGANTYRTTWIQDDVEKYYGDESPVGMLEEEGSVIEMLERSENKSKADIERIERFYATVKAEEGAEEERCCTWNWKRQTELPRWWEKWRNEKAAQKTGPAVDSPLPSPC